MQPERPAAGMSTAASSALWEDIARRVAIARSRVAGLVRVTPLEHSSALSAPVGGLRALHGPLSSAGAGSARIDPGDAKGHVFLKAEHQQLTGSFKLRGATNKLRSLSREQLAKGVVTASTGNHALGTLEAVGRLQAEMAAAGSASSSSSSPSSIPPLAIYLPRTAAAGKLDALRKRGAQLVLFGDDCEAAEVEARRAAEASGRVYISPYNDAEVCAGQGTLAAELGQQVELKAIDAVFVTVGGGGLIGGIGAYLKKVAPHIRVVGVQPAENCCLYESIQAGRILTEFTNRATLSDASAGGMEAGAFTFDLAKQVIDEWCLVSEEEIAKAMAFLLETHHYAVEGAAAATVAAFQKSREKYKNANVILVLCGGNLSSEHLRVALAQLPST